MRRNFFGTGLSLMLMFLVFSPVSFGAPPWRTAERYDQKISEKLTYGVQNTLLGWTEVIEEPEMAAEDGKDTWAALGRGIRNAFWDTLGGAAIMGTFFIPQIDIPLPHDGVQT